MTSTKAPLDILFIPFVGVGHVNACIGIAQVLIDAGHRVSFAVSEPYGDRLARYGIHEHILPGDGTEQNGRAHNVDPDTILAEVFFKLGNVFCDLSPLEKVSQRAGGMKARVDYYMKLDGMVDRLLKCIPKPDLIVVDQLLSIPTIELSGIPYVWSWSTNPLLMADDERTPPSASGLSASGDPLEWQTFRAVRDKTFRTAWETFNSYVISRGCEPLRTHQFANTRKCLTIYGYPLELDYIDQRPLPANFVRFDNLKRQVDSPTKFEIPAPLLNKPGKLIYFSLGSMGAVDVPNMRRLVAILHKSPHRFIVSKGPKHTEYELPDNMWGAGSVPQLQVLPLVDLVITHGGNNTVTETLYYGRPMIVMPLFGDQYDNAQRVHEKGFGRRLDAYKCGERELLGAVDELLADEGVNRKLFEVSRRIRADNSIARLPEVFADFVVNREKYINF